MSMLTSPSSPQPRGKAGQQGQSLEGQVLVVQAADLLQTRKVITDFPTWAQCFALNTAVLTADKKDRVADLMAYQAAEVVGDFPLL